MVRKDSFFVFLDNCFTHDYDTEGDAAQRRAGIAELPIARPLEPLVLNDFNPIPIRIQNLAASVHTTLEHLTILTKATFFIRPSVSLFFHATPFSSNLAQALSKSSTLTAICPNPCGSEFPS